MRATQYRHLPDVEKLECGGRVAWYEHVIDKDTDRLAGTGLAECIHRTAHREARRRVVEIGRGETGREPRDVINLEQAVVLQRRGIKDRARDRNVLEVFLAYLRRHDDFVDDTIFRHLRGCQWRAKYRSQCGTESCLVLFTFMRLSPVNASLLLIAVSAP